ncbi:glycoside hydrolase family 5 protein [Spongorhabdus nitratireducens]
MNNHKHSARACGYLALILFIYSGFFATAGGYDRKTAFWTDAPRHGANCYNIKVDEDWFKAAKAAGINWIRLTWDKWPGEGQDFLAGDLDNYHSLQPNDLRQLLQTLDLAYEHQLSVVLVPLGLPGCRWIQNNDGKRDSRLWRDKRFQQQAEQFWFDLAQALKLHPAIVGYSLLSAPATEAANVWPDLSLRLLQAIRKADIRTPVIIESADFGSPGAWTSMTPAEDDRTLYAVHFMAPWDYSSRFNFTEKRGYRYPGAISVNKQSEYWDRKRLEQELARFTNWADSHKIPRHRLLVSALGCFRRNPDAAIYLKDVTSILNQNRMHWAFYAFREDAWDGYDFECGSDGFGEAWWKAHDNGEPLPRPRKPNPLWQVIQDALKL